MRSRHLVPGLLLLVPAIGCKAKVDKSPAGTASAQALGPIAQAMASAVPPHVDLETSITGNVHSVGGELGTWDITLNSCHSGETQGFYGVDFSTAGSDDLRLRYVHDEAAGEVVKVMYPNKTLARVFNRDDSCTILEGSIQKMNMTVWTPKGRIRYLQGHVKFDCKQTGGKGRVTGEATFSGCH
jgi:hypothetical protein